MILDIYKATGDLNFVKRVFPSLLKEHSFWMSGKPLRNAAVQLCFCIFHMVKNQSKVASTLLDAEVHNVAIMDKHGEVHNLCRYQAMFNKPRPESATIVKSLPNLPLSWGNFSRGH
jgi:alpha,alpha-trehalase